MSMHLLMFPMFKIMLFLVPVNYVLCRKLLDLRASSKLRNTEHLEPCRPKNIYLHVSGYVLIRVGLGFSGILEFSLTIIRLNLYRTLFKRFLP